MSALGPRVWTDRLGRVVWTESSRAGGWVVWTESSSRAGGVDGVLLKETACKNGNSKTTTGDEKDPVLPGPLSHRGRSVREVQWGRVGPGVLGAYDFGSPRRKHKISGPRRPARNPGGWGCRP